MYNNVAGSWNLCSLFPFDIDKLMYHWDVKCSMQIV